MQKVRTLKCFTKYKCLQDKCQQSCCKKWNISVDKETIDKWKEKAPQLLRFIEEKKNDKNEIIGYRTKRENGDCCYLKNDMCSIQLEYGEGMIPNLCGYFPHLYKDFENDNIYTSINLSCPAVVQAILFANKQDDWTFVNWKPNYINKHIFSYKNDITIPYNEVEELFVKVSKLFDEKKTNFDILLATFVKVCFENYELSTKEFSARLQSDFTKYKKQILQEYRKKENKHKVSDVCFNALQTFYQIEGDRYLKDICCALNIQNKDGKVEIRKIAGIMTKYNELITNYKKHTKTQIDKILKNYFKCRLAHYLYPATHILKGTRSTLTYIICELMVIKLALICLIKTKKDLADKEKIIYICARIGRSFYGRKDKTTYEKIDKNYWCNRNTLNDYILYY